MNLSLVQRLAILRACRWVQPHAARWRDPSTDAIEHEHRALELSLARLERGDELPGLRVRVDEDGGLVDEHGVRVLDDVSELAAFARGFRAGRRIGMDEARGQLGLPLRRSA